MGLTLHYELSAPECSAANAGLLIVPLRRHAQSLPFVSVSDRIVLQGEECRFNPANRDDPHSWLKVQTTRFLAKVDGEVIVSADNLHPIHIIAFTVDPGDGCENANFGLCRYPSKSRNWSWSSFCKTQYASNPSTGDVANFLKCHLGLVALLDKAKEMGILGPVKDEGHYWDHRDIAALVKEVGMWNRMIAGFYGGLRDAVEAAGGDPRALQAEITKFRDFERLEMEGRRTPDSE